MAAFLYLGAGLGLLIYQCLTKKREKNEPLTKENLPYTIGMIVLDIEIVATSLIAFFIFKEAISKKLGLAIVLVTIASIALSFEGTGSFDFNIGSLFVIGAASCWGLENNCTRMLSSKSSVQITTIKGIFSGLGSLIVALVIGESFPALVSIFAVLVLGFISYGLSINFYIKAQKDLGVAKTSAYYAISPFLGVAFGMLLLNERPGIQFYVGLVIMIVATVLMIEE